MGWAEDLGPTAGLVECDGEQHEVRWDPECGFVVGRHDADAEQALAALSGDGELDGCVGALAAWRAMSTGYASLDVWGPSQSEGSDLVRGLRSEPSLHAVEKRDRSSFHRSLLQLIRQESPGHPKVLVLKAMLHAHSLPVPVLERAVLRALESAFAEQTRLAAFDSTRLQVTARTWLAYVLRLTGPERRTSIVDVFDLDDDQPPSVIGHVDHAAVRLAAWIGPEWLRDVLRRGAAAVDGHAVLAAEPGTRPCTLDVMAVRWRWRPGIPDGDQEAVVVPATIAGDVRQGWRLVAWHDGG